MHWRDGLNRAAELVRRRVDLILAITTPAAIAAKGATTTVPIVFEVGADPVTLGLVTSLNQPGGNLTGVSLLNVELGAKRLEFLHEVAPTTKIVGLMVNPTSPNAAALSKDARAAAPKSSNKPVRCPLLAQSGHGPVHRTCPLLRVKRTSLPHRKMSAFDPKRTSASKNTEPKATPNDLLEPSLARAMIGSLQRLI
jgi:hypothetical protein